MLLPSSAAGTNGGTMTGREREEASESLWTTLSTGRWGKAWAEHILKARSCSRGWACSTHGCMPRWSSPLATWAARTCLRMIWLVLAGRNGSERSKDDTEPPSLRYRGGRYPGGADYCVGRGQWRDQRMLLWLFLCFPLSSLCWLCEQVEERGRKGRAGTAHTTSAGSNSSPSGSFVPWSNSERSL